MHLIILKSNKLNLMQYIKFSLKQSEVNQSHSQDKQKLSSLEVECFWAVVGHDPKAFLLKS